MANQVLNMGKSPAWIRKQRTPLDCGLHVLQTEADALHNLVRFYETHEHAQDSFNNAIRIIADRVSAGGKVIIVGVGKSGHIGKKLVAMLQSLGILAVFLHPTEALHGDLGLVNPEDIALFISSSGKTPEILLLLHYLDSSLPVILISSHEQPETCEFLSRRPDALLLPAPIPECEYVSFGVSSPSTSTTTSLALGDALSIAAAHEMHKNLATVFALNHPGGAISDLPRRAQTADNFCVPLRECRAWQPESTRPYFKHFAPLSYQSRAGLMWKQMVELFLPGRTGGSPS